MLIRSMHESEGKPVDMPGARDVHMQLLIGREHGAPSFSMRRFTVEPGGHTPLHHHNYEHEIVVLSGEGEAESAAGPRPIREGDVLYVPANETHQFRNSGPRPLVFLCFVPGQFDCGGTVMPVPGS